MSSLKENIIAITLGIRFTRTFRIPDVSGSIIDNILTSEDSPFKDNFFSNVQDTFNREKILQNGQSGDYLRINTDDFILRIKVNNNFEVKFNWLENEIVSFFQKAIFDKYHIKNILRIGIVFSHEILGNNALRDSTKKLVEDNGGEVENINLAFSKKLLAQEGLYRKGVNDYTNVIYSIRQIEKNKFFADLDYQYYNEPAIEDLRNCNIGNILKDAKSFLNNNFHTWLRKYEEEKS